ncbi:MAG: peptide ABC transporter, partial [Algoriphagus sp.]|nr:peptide ABC transporter [Algoriphagus sp.]
MLSFVLRRAASLAISLLVASVVIFFVLEVLPGDPARFMLGLNASPGALAALRTQLGLDAPV